MNVYIDPKWTFRDLVRNARRLKQEYIFCLTFFSYNYTFEELKYRNNIIRNIKKNLYALDIEEWKIDKVWEYMNEDLTHDLLRMILCQIDKKKKK
jgi:hypothetical protein